MNKAHLGLSVKIVRFKNQLSNRYNGRWIKELGDGVMASFNTVSDAVHGEEG